jgi:hypothetical protein
MSPIGIANAPWWMNNSTVILKGLYLAEDDAYVANNLVSVQNPGESNMEVQTLQGSQGLLKLQRMVSKDSVVSVMLRSGDVHTVNLPSDAGQLLPIDVTYILTQINAMSQPMSAQEQIDFLASANAPSEETSQAAS